VRRSAGLENTDFSARNEPKRRGKEDDSF